jgi:hypothetical protein
LDCDDEFFYIKIWQTFWKNVLTTYSPIGATGVGSVFVHWRCQHLAPVPVPVPVLVAKQHTQKYER